MIDEGTPDDVVLRPDDLTHAHTLDDPMVVVCEEMKKLQRRVVAASLAATLVAYLAGLRLPGWVWRGEWIGLALTLVVWALFTFVWPGSVLRIQETAASLATRPSRSAGPPGD